MVFVVGNVSAETYKLGDNKVTLPTISAVGKGTDYADSWNGVRSASSDNSETVFTFDDDQTTLKLLDKDSKAWLDKEAAWVGFHADSVPNVTGGNTNVSYKMSFTRPNGTVQKYFNGKSSDFNTTGSFDIVVPITIEDLQQAVLGDGIITRNYILTWNISENTAGEPGKNSVEIKQNVIFKINANQIQIQDEREESDTNGKTIWDEKTATIYKLQHPETPATPAEEDKTTEENKKDDVPKTGEVI